MTFCEVTNIDFLWSYKHWLSVKLQTLTFCEVSWDMKGIIHHLFLCFFHLFCKQNKYTSNFSSNTMYMSTSFGTKTIEVLHRFHFSYTLLHWSKTFALLQSFTLSLSHTHSRTTHTHAPHTLTHNTHSHTCYLCSYEPHRITICYSSYILFITICY